MSVKMVVILSEITLRKLLSLTGCRCTCTQRCPLSLRRSLLFW